MIVMSKKPIPTETTTSLERHLIWALLYDDAFKTIFPELFRSDLQRKEVYDFLADHYRKGTDTADITADFWKHYPVLANQMEEEARNGLIESLPHYHGLLEEVRKESEERLRQRLVSLQNPDDVIKEVERFNADRHGIENAIIKWYNAVELKEMSKNFKPLQWLIPGFIQAGLVLLVGTHKSGKSYFNLQLAYEIALGGEVLGYPDPDKPGETLMIDAGQTLFLDLEVSKELTWERLEQIAAKRAGELPKGLTIQNYEFLKDAEDLTTRFNEVENWIKAQPNPKLVIIDTKQAFLGVENDPKGRESDYAAAVRTLTPFRDLANKYNITVLITHHTNKGSKYTDPFDRSLGSTGIPATADEILVLDRPRNGQEATLDVTGRRIREARYKLIFDTDADDRTPWQWVGDAKKADLSDTRKEIISVLSGLSQGMTAKQLHESWFPEKTLNNIRVTLSRMVSDKLLSLSDGFYTIREDI